MELIIGNKKTISWINYAKAICMLVVILFHTEWYSDYRLYILEDFYEPFFTNTFFFLSGYLLFRKQLSQPVIDEKVAEWIKNGGRKMVLNVLYRIAIPSVLFTIIVFLPKKLIRGEVIAYKDLLIESIGGCCYWFTSALVIAELIMFILLLTRYRQISFYFFISVLIAFLGIYYKQNPLYFCGNENFPWCYAKGMRAMAYLAIGAVFWKYENSVSVLFEHFNKYFILLFITIVYFIMIMTVNNCDEWIIKNFCVLIRDSFGILLIIRLCMLIKKFDWLSFIGVNSLGFYLFSGAIPNVYVLLFNRFSVIPMPIKFAIVYLLSISTIYIILLFLTRFSPWMFDLRLLRKKHVL